MVKKLFKYECVSYFRTLLPMQIILLGLALLNRFIQLFEGQSKTAYKILFVSSVVMVCVAAVVLLVMTVATVITRYYKNLFTYEGYLSFTLPVTTDQHLWVKLLSALLFSVISFAVVLLSGFIATLGDVGIEIFRAVGFIGKEFARLCGIHTPFFVLEAIIIILTALAVMYLLFYACTTVGQLARKNRILAAFGVYFGYYIFNQILGTVFIIVVTLLRDVIPFEAIADFIHDHPFASVHTGFGLYMVISVVLGLLYYLVCRVIIKKRLNLE